MPCYLTVVHDAYESEYLDALYCVNNFLFARGETVHLVFIDIINHLVLTAHRANN